MRMRNRFALLLGWMLVAGLLLSGCSAWFEAAPLAAAGPAVWFAQAAPGTGNTLQQAARLPDRLKFEPFTLESDLEVLSMVQDRQGFLWLGARDSLVRYDGYQFKRYQPEGAGFDLFSARILYEDRLGRIWSAIEGGLARFDPAGHLWTWYPQQMQDPQRLSAGPITGLAEDAQGDIWVSLDGGGLNRLEPDTGQVARFSHRPSDPRSLRSEAVTALAVTRAGQVWAGTSNGTLERLDDPSGVFTHYEMPRSRMGSAGRAIEALLEDPSGDLWLAVRGGLLGFDPQLGSFTFFAPPTFEAGEADRPNSLVLDAAGNFWIGTEGAGLFRFNPRSGEWARYRNDPNDAYSLSENQIAGLMLDRSGILWITFNTGRVDRFDPGAGFRAYRSARGNPNSLSDDAVSAVVVDGRGDWWVGAGDEGVDRFEPRAGRWTHFRPDPAQSGSLGTGRVTALAAGQDGHIWAATQGSGLSGLIPETGRWTRYPADASTTGALSNPHVNALLAGLDGRLWIGAEDGILNALDPRTGRFEHFVIPGDLSGANSTGPFPRAITALAEDAGGRIWVGTLGGILYGFEPAIENWQAFPIAAAAGADGGYAPIASLWASAGGLIWAGAGDAGLFGLNPRDGSVVRYTAENNLPGSAVFAILEDGRRALWLSTDLGLARFDPVAGRFQLFDSASGLPGEPFTATSAFRSESGELFFGGPAGLVAFYPELVEPNLHVPPVVITDFQLLYESISPGSSSPLHTAGEADEIRLDYTQNVFTFEYAALDFANPAENRYAYRLEGFDPNWVEAGTRRQASYTNLAPGEYLFRVIGSNNAGVWNESGASVRVVILPPFWLTSWFRLSVAGLSLAFLAGAVGLRLGAVNRQKRELQRQVEARTAELKTALRELEESREAAERTAVLEERQRLARELHDSVTQLLYGQVLSADISYKYLKKGDLDALEKNLVGLQEIAGQSLKEMRLLLYELRPSSFEEEGLANALDVRLDAVERRSRIESSLEVSGPVDLSPAVAWEVYRIAIEALNNSLKHAEATRVAVRLQSADGFLELEVRDNGQGFAPEGDEKGGFGINSMRQRAKGIGGQLEIESGTGQGTRVWVKVPKA